MVSTQGLTAAPHPKTDLLAGLNPNQHEAVVSQAPAVLVLAGAGTGKTRVITLRIAHMISQGVPPEQIVGLSFTNKAAGEMKDRLGALVGRSLADKVLLSTFHSFSLGILREFAHAAGLRQDFGIVDENDSWSLLRECLRECRLEEFFPIEAVKSRIASLKDGLQTLEDIRSRGRIVDSVMLAEVFDRYNRRLRLYNLVDFDDLIYLSALAVRNAPQLQEQLHTRWTHYLVDEFQDTSRGQFDFLKRLIPKGGQICAVGDDDQSIYSWRGADPRVLRSFLDDFASSQLVTLDQNYRCSPLILDAANAVIRQNKDRLAKELWSNREDRAPIIHYTANSDEEEASFISRQIAALHATGTPYREIAILYRSTHLVNLLEDALKKHGIPYSLTNSQTLSDKREIRDVLALLALAHNPHDLRSTFRAIEALGCHLSLKKQEEIVHELCTRAEQRERPLLKVILEVSGGAAPKLKETAGEIHKLQKQFCSCSHFNDLAEHLENWFRHSEYRVRLRSSSSSMKAALAKEDMLNRFFELIRNLENNKPGRSLLAAVLDRFADNAMGSLQDSDEDRINLLTIHGSKGLEFGEVFLIGLEEGILPHEKSLEDKNEEEERRLMYVAMTRAKRRLYLSHCQFRKSQRAKHGAPQVSRFLADIPQELCVDAESFAESGAARRAEAARRLFERFR